MTHHIFDTAAVLMMLAAAFGYLNHRFFKLPFAIGLLLSALLASTAVLAVDWLVPSLQIGVQVRELMAGIDFTEALLHGMLSFLLFAGALHVNLNELIGKIKTILTLATVGVLVSAGLVGVTSYYVFNALGAPVPFLWCLVFGALIAPTDPVAVLGIMRAAGASRGHEIKIVGESLFNDGIGVVLFTVLVRIASGSTGTTGHSLSAGGIAEILLIEVAGGLAIGLIAGYIAYLAMRSLNEPNLEILISVALVMGVTFISLQLHASAPLACVAAGLLIGNQGRRLAMSDPTRELLDAVWGFFDEALNAVLFLLVGLEVLAVPFARGNFVAALLLVPIALLARYVSVALPVTALRRFETFTPGAIRVLTWGGLKGGISVALALSLPQFPGRPVVLEATYAIVLFSIVVQGLTVGRLIRSIQTESEAAESTSAA